MANFQASLTNPTTLVADIQTSEGCTSLIINDDSNYSTNTESGHTEADFSQYRVVNIQYMNVSSYLMTSLPQPTPPPIIFTPIPPASSGQMALGLPLITGDGWYQITLNTVPTYNPSASYVAFVNQVFYNGVLYTSTQSSTAQQPDISPAFWEVTTILYPKYSVIVTIALTCQQTTCLASLLSQAFCDNSNFACTDMSNNTAFQDFLKVLMINYGVNIANNLNQLTFTTNYFNAASLICGCKQPSNNNYQQD